MKAVLLNIILVIPTSTLPVPGVSFPGIDAGAMDMCSSICSCPPAYASWDDAIVKNTHIAPAIIGMNNRFERFLNIFIA